MTAHSGAGWVAGDAIHAITRFHLDHLYPRFGLSLSLPEPD
ncbi:MAG: hypothetical protein ACRDPO_37660 [Streptosporangiaceae bacterium]